MALSYHPLICAFVFAHADCWFSHAVAQMAFLQSNTYQARGNGSEGSITLFQEETQHQKSSPECVPAVPYMYVSTRISEKLRIRQEEMDQKGQSHYYKKKPSIKRAVLSVFLWCHICTFRRGFLRDI